MSDEHATAYLCADIVVLRYLNNVCSVLLIERAWPPYEGQLALPGGFVNDGETFIQAAQRELHEETGLVVDVAMLHPVNVYDAPDRDPRGRFVSVAYATLLDEPVEPVAGDDARTAQWVLVDDVLAHPERLAFDHARVLQDMMIR